MKFYKQMISKYGSEVIRPPAFDELEEIEIPKNIPLSPFYDPGETGTSIERKKELDQEIDQKMEELKQLLELELGEEVEAPKNTIPAPKGNVFETKGFSNPWEKVILSCQKLFDLTQK